MLEGVNDQVEHAKQLVELINQQSKLGLSCKFNLIPFNPFPESGLLCSSKTQVAIFAKILMDAGLVTTIRKTRGDDIDAACGQLAGEVMDRTRVGARIEKQRTIKITRVEDIPASVQH